jgi:hypothetical protein
MCFGLIAAIAEKPVLAETDNITDSNQSVQQTGNETDDVNDPNNKSKQKAVSDLDKAGQQEVREWVQAKIEQKEEFILTARKRYNEEFNLIRELAVEENALKTVDAINRLLENKNKRFEEILKAVQRQEERQRREKLDERRQERGRDRDTRGRGRGQQQRPGSRRRPTNRR